MPVHLHIDQVRLATPEPRNIGEVMALVSPSPYDIPVDATLDRLPSGIFQIEFEYLSAGEPVHAVSTGDFSLEVGRNSGRLFRLRGYSPGQIPVGRMLQSLADLKSGNPRRSGHYDTVAQILYQAFRHDTEVLRGPVLASSGSRP